MRTGACTRWISNIEVDFSLPSERVIRALKQIISWRGKPQVIRCNNGQEKISDAIQNRAEGGAPRLNLEAAIDRLLPLATPDKR